ncbi:MAG: hypothetical protein ABI654_07810 [Betaproteobacteria bacterium]
MSLEINAQMGSVVLDTLGLAATVEWHAYQFQKATGIHCELKVNDAVAFEVPEAYAESVFEKFNESLNEILSRARADRVSIELNIVPQEVALVLRDNGGGVPAAFSLPLPSGLF